MIRWSYVISRLIMATLLLVVLWALTNPVLRWAMIFAGQAIVGAKVEIDSVRTILTRSRLDVSTINISDPQSPMKNLVTAERATFDIDMRSALLRRLVITKAHVSGLTFHSDRASSGQLDRDSDEHDLKPSITDKVSDYGQRWIESSLTRLEHQFENDLKSIRLANDFETRWPREYDRVEQQAEDLARRGKLLAQRIEQYADNPLGHLEQLQPTLIEIDRMRREVFALKTELDRLKKQVGADRVAIREAKEHDEAYLREKLCIDVLNPQSLSEYLLGPEIHSRLGAALEWIKWGRQHIPHGQKTEKIQRTARGINVIFPSMRNTPEFLIRSLEIDGHGTVDGRPFRFAGSIDDITHQPRRHDKPATANVKSLGAIEMTAQAVVDRRGEHPVEQIRIDIPSLVQPGCSLGEPQHLSVAVSPGRAHVQVRLDITGDNVDGNLSFEQNNVRLEPHLPKAYSKQILAGDLAPAFASVNTIHAEVHVDGSITRPRWTLDSNLGPQLAEALNRAFRTELAARERQLQTKTDQLINEQLAQAEQKLIQRHADVLKKLDLGDRELAMIKTQIATRLGTSSNVLERGKKLFDRFR
jgi:uncharacterized protein (TIGR03545 family)